MPEDDKRKMIAYANRIMSGAQVSPEIIYALESLVRKYGPVDGALKALGSGCARLGELDRARQYLCQARHEDPMDTELVSKLLEIFLAREEFKEAEKMGTHLLESLGDRTDPSDLARLVLAHIGSGNIDKAQALVESRPDLDNGRLLLKKAKKRIYGSSGVGLVSFLGNLNPLEKFMALGRRAGVQNLSQRAARLVNGGRNRPEPGEDEFPWLEEIDFDAQDPPEKEGVPDLISKMEYWVYSRDTQLPKWESIKAAFEEELGRSDKKMDALARLNKLIDDGSLKIDNFLRSDAEHLFNLPADFVRDNSRGLTDRDLRTLSHSGMLVRVRLSCPMEEALESLFTLVPLVEAIRRLTAGLVQDVTSHTIWGIWEWRDKVVSDPVSDLLGLHVKLDTLDEGGKVWIHTHGMQKFGYPEFEMEEVPSELTAGGQRMTLTLCRLLLDLEEPLTDLNSSVKIPGAPFMVAIRQRPPDDEGHFPVGSAKAMPYVTDYDPESPDTIKHTLKMFMARIRPNAASSGKASEAVNDSEPEPGPQDESEEQIPALDLRTRLLEAHRAARSGLMDFKEKFKVNPSREAEIFAVKVGFRSPSGDYEWMWVSLEEWRGATLVGRLQNSPSLRKDLEKGGPVHITEAEIFDWAVISREQGVVQGAFTESVLSDHRSTAMN
jgi:uncharacterized protein YegJ (DUF2314 family)